MNLLVIAGRLARRPWSAGAMAARLVNGLVERGHAVNLICECIEDEQQFARAARVIARSPCRNGDSEFPAAFAFWALARSRTIPNDASLSLTRRAAGDVWMPLTPDAAAWTASIRHTRSPISFATSMARNAGVLLDAAAQALSPIPQGPEIERVICTGGPCVDAARSFAGQAIADRVVRAPLTSELALPDEAARERLRVTSRSTLALAEHRLVLLSSFMAGSGRFLGGLLSALASLNPAPGDQNGPALIVLTEEPYAAHAAAVRARCDRHVRILGTTSNPAPLFAACDAAATCVPVGVDAFRFGSTCRFPADAIRSGRPVLALAGSSGTGALGLATPDLAVPGLVVGTPSPTDWVRAINQASDRSWLANATHAAGRLAPQLEPSRLLDVVENALQQAAQGAV